MYGDRAGEILIASTEKIVGNNPIVIGTIDDKVCYGHIFLVKRTLGDTVFVCFGGQIPSATNYHVILTDDFPIFDDAVVIGDVRALGTASTSVLSTYARGGRFPGN
jgi:hypothetical protein